MTDPVLTDAQWKVLEPLLPILGGTRRGRPYCQSHRTTLEAILWIAQAGTSWRFLPREYGKWKSVHRRFRRWVNAKIFERIFETMASMLDLDIIMVDGTFIKVHQSAAGARREGRSRAASREQQAIGRSKGGLNTLLVALVDKNGRFIRYALQPGNSSEHRNVTSLIGDLPANEFLGDGLYDSDKLRFYLTTRGIKPTIPPRKNRKAKLEFDRHSYMGRHTIENVFADLKQFRGIATRYCKLADSFRGYLDLVMWVIGTRETRRSASPYHRDLSPLPV